MIYRKVVKTKSGFRTQEKKRYRVEYKYQYKWSKVIHKSGATEYAYNKEEATKLLQNRLPQRIMFAFKVSEVK